MESEQSAQANSNQAPILERIRALEMEIETLRVAANEQEKLVVQGYAEMDRMLADVEQQRNQVAKQSEETARALGSLARITDTMDEILFVIDVQGRIAKANRRLIDLSGYAESELLGHPADMLFLPSEIDRLRSSTTLPYETTLSQVYQLFSATKDSVLDGTLLGRNGEHYPTLFRFALLFSNKGKKEGVVVVGSDMREIRSAFSTIEAARNAMRLVLDHVEEGLVIADRNGVLASERSRVLDQWFGVPVAGMPVWEYLIGGENPTLSSWLELAWSEVFEEIMPVDVTIDQLPRRISRSAREFSVAYIPIPKDAKIERILVVLEDITTTLARERAELAQKDILAALSRSIKDRQGFVQFFREMSELVSNVTKPTVDLSWLRRTIHTIKGTCSVVGVVTVAKACHELESLMADSPEAFPTSDQLRPVHQAWSAFAGQVAPLLGLDEGAIVLTVDAHDYRTVLANVRSRTRHSLIEGLLQSWLYEPGQRRLIQIAEQIRGLAQHWGYEEPTIAIRADDVRFPADPWAGFWGVFPHLYRNALDHGIEPAEERESKGKPRGGRFRLELKAQSEQFILEFADDGRGVDWDRVRLKARGLGLPAESRSDLVNAILTDGFSSRDSADERSGRGVGLSAVHEATKALRGQIEVESTPEAGTVFRMTFPLTNVWLPPT